MLFSFHTKFASYKDLLRNMDRNGFWASYLLKKLCFKLVFGTKKSRSGDIKTEANQSSLPFSLKVITVVHYMDGAFTFCFGTGIKRTVVATNERYEKKNPWPTLILLRPFFNFKKALKLLKWFWSKKNNRVNKRWNER